MTPRVISISAFYFTHPHNDAARDRALYDFIIVYDQYKDVR